MTRYYYIEPEVAGGIGEKSVLDRSVHPPIVTRLHYEFDGWLGDALLESFPSFIMTEDAARRLLQAHVTGAMLGDVEISTSEVFKELYPRRQLPKFVWLQITGRAGYDDFGVAVNHRLVISERVHDILKTLGISHAEIGPFSG